MYTYRFDAGAFIPRELTEFLAKRLIERLTENSRFIKATLAATAACAAVASLYQRMYSSNPLPFDRGAASLTHEEVNNLKAASQKYSPTELTSRLFTYINQPQLKKSDFEGPKNPQEWLKWLSFNTPASTQPILPSPKKDISMTLEDEKASNIQSWAMSLQPLFALLKDAIPLKEFLQPIQASPRLAYTILFNCIAPFAAQTLWKEAQGFLPTSIQEKVNLYTTHHKGKIALATLGLLVWLYSKMTRERGIITNLTENYTSCRKAHQGLDLIPSYRQGIDQLLRTLELSSKSNILWYRPENKHSTFVNEIGDILGEMTATGRIFSDKIKEAEFPGLKNLQILEFDVQSFLNEYLTPETVREGWNETLRHLTKNSLVIFKNIDDIKPHLLPKIPTNDGPPDSSNLSPPHAKVLFNLISSHLKKGQFKCLIEITEDEKRGVLSKQENFDLFSPTRAPDINNEELIELCHRLYTAPDISCPFAKEDIQIVFKQMRSALENNSIPPRRLMDTIQGALKTRARSWHLKNITAEEKNAIEKAELHLDEAQHLKNQLLQKLWQEKHLKSPASPSLLKALLLVEHVVLPLYRRTDFDLKEKFLTPPKLVDEMQKEFLQLFGPSRSEELSKLKMLSTKLKEEIKGQDLAIDTICDAILRWRRVPPLDGKPLVLFFGGSPGVGKSAIVKKIAYHLISIYGIEEKAVKNQEDNVTRVYLNRPDQGGIFGWEGPQSTILDHLLYVPTNVVLLEEWDKMKEKDNSVLLDLLDDTPNHLKRPWSFSNTNGPFVNKSSAIFILNANVAIKDSKAPFKENVAAIRAGIISRYKKKPEEAYPFLDRLAEIVPFQGIFDDGANELIIKYLDQYQEQEVLPVQLRQSVEKTIFNTTEMPKDGRNLQQLVQEAIHEALKSEDKKK